MQSARDGTVGRRCIRKSFEQHSPSFSRLRSSTDAHCIATMFYDLNVPWTENHRELQRTIAFLDECKETAPKPLLSQLTEAVLTHTV
jgi:hypothetical protein